MIKIKKKKFKISNCGPIEYILRIKVEKQNNRYIISQKSFIENMLDKFNITNTHKRKTSRIRDDTTVYLKIKNHKQIYV